MAKVKIEYIVTLNGTDKNPWHLFDLRCNPFPQLARMQTDAAERILAELDGDPIPHSTPGEAAEYIRRKLNGFSNEFVELCVNKFIPGQRVQFTVSWYEDK